MSLNLPGLSCQEAVKADSGCISRPTAVCMHASAYDWLSALLPSWQDSSGEFRSSCLFIRGACDVG